MPGSGGLLETNNTLEHPTGPEYQLVVGEGTYVLKDDLHLATPPPHPSDAPQPNNNPLATKIDPPSAGTRLSTALLSSRKPPTPGLFRFITNQSVLSNVHPIEEEAQSPRSDAGSVNGFGSSSFYHDNLPTFGDGNPALIPPPVKSKKGERGKPKNNILKSNSSFVSRVIPHETLQKRLQDRASDGIFAFANINRSFLWLDLSSETKVENLTKVLFTKAHCLCHDINTVTKSKTHLDVILGFNTADIIWYEPMSQKYARLNKNGIINPAHVTSIQWLPNKENYFVAAHANGTLVVYDKEKEDAEFVPEDLAVADGSEASINASMRLQIKKSVHSANQKSNPVAVWHIPYSPRIHATSFSPDGQHLAIVCSDGTLTVINFLREKVIDVYRSYYGALLTVTWSPDGRYILTGGQDDLVSIWSLADRALVARCVGHESWVNDVKFDPWRCDERNYRFGSVGEDCRLLLWDFSVGMLAKPRAMSIRPTAQSQLHGRNSVGSGGIPLVHRRETSSSSSHAFSRLRTNSSLSRTVTDDTEANGADGVNGEEELVHAVESRTATAVLPPVMTKAVDKHPLCWLGFEEGCILTACKDGHIREWSRPTEPATNSAVDSSSTVGSSFVALP
ncbi:WD40 repeat-like protein [Polychaeton citri CBS 116435]|uniref:WD40 repeat-like protein n=1 Tax=Polychaeton citri CBS 116435 TaxID=1314669 RepID=A0A9P4UM23_9PEZI|nr:WD40 repeat-like protein [Polychaeton citri CBS 116435]